jgi:hypothetical protein
MYVKPRYQRFRGGRILEEREPRTSAKAGQGEAAWSDWLV